MKKLIISFLLSLLFIPSISKADTDVFLNLGLGLGIPAPVYVVPSPVVYSVPSFASASLVSEISPNTFLSFSLGIPAPFYVAPAPVYVYPPVYYYPSSTIVFGYEPYYPYYLYPPPFVFAPRHVHFHPHGGPPGHYKHHFKHHNYPFQHAYRGHKPVYKRNNPFHYGYNRREFVNIDHRHDNNHGSKSFNKGHRGNKTFKQGNNGKKFFKAKHKHDD